MREVIALPAGVVGRCWFHRPLGRMHVWHHHDELEFNLVTAGTARYLVGDRRFDLAPGTLIWLFPAQEHLLVDLSPDFACWIAVIRPRPLRDAARSPAFAGLNARDPAGRFVRGLARADARHLEAVCADAADGARDLANAAATYLFLAAWRRFAAAPGAAGAVVHPAVERAAALIAADPSADLGHVARRAGLSGSRLSRLFHAQLGQTLVAFRARARLERFHALRETRPGRSLLALALDAGFGSYAQFHRTYRRATGRPPRLAPG